MAAAVAGANWGRVFVPRLGQEVLVQFVAGDIDRAVVVGALYNGQGSVDAQGNQLGSAAADDPQRSTQAPFNCIDIGGWTLGSERPDMLRQIGRNSRNIAVTVAEMLRSKRSRTQ